MSINASSGNPFGSAINTNEIADGGVTDAKLASGLNGEGHITISPNNYNAIIQGTWTFAIAANHFLNGTFSQAAGAQNDEINYKVYLAKGTYKIRSLHYESSNRGIMNFLLDGTLVGTIDTYNVAGSVFNQMKETSTFVVTESGLKTLSLKMATKHASATAYDVSFQQITLIRTA